MSFEGLTFCCCYCADLQFLSYLLLCIWKRWQRESGAAAAAPVFSLVLYRMNSIKPQTTINYSHKIILQTSIEVMEKETEHGE